MPYTAVQQLIDAGNPSGMRNYWRGELLSDLTDEAIGTIVAAAGRKASPMTQLVVVPGGGAVARVAEDDTATGGRSSPWNVHLLSLWADAGQDAANIAWTRGLSDALDPWKAGRNLLNFSSEEGGGVVRKAVGEGAFARLAALKAAWDPDGMFAANRGIAAPSA